MKFCTTASLQWDRVRETWFTWWAISQKMMGELKCVILEKYLCVVRAESSCMATWEVTCTDLLLVSLFLSVLPIHLASSWSAFTTKLSLDKMVQLTAGYGNRGVEAIRKRPFVFSAFGTRRLNVTQLTLDRCMSPEPSNKIKSSLTKPSGNEPMSAPGMPPHFLEAKYALFILQQ